MSVAPPPVSLEACLAWLYADPGALEAFLAAPEAVIAAAGLNEHDAAALRAVDRVGLVMAARSYDNKRSGRRASRS